MSVRPRGRSRAIGLAFVLLTTLVAVTGQRTSAADTTLVVWPIGDSITYGVSASHHDVRGGYRLPLARGLLDHGVRVHYVGTSAGNAAPGLTGFGLRHDGHSGWTTADVLDRLPSWSVPTPDVVVVALGTNDLRHHRSTPESAVFRLGQIVRSLSERFPLTTVVVTAIVPSGTAGGCDATTREYDGLVRQLVGEQVLLGRRVELADVWASYTSGACTTRRGLLSRDRIHPTAAGYSVMGSVLVDVLARVAEARRTLRP